MLNNDAMAQLQGLKQEIEAQKEQAEATVKGTQNRYGFAVVDDGREIFIPPDEMLKVLPGDRVGICIRPAPNRDRKAKSTLYSPSRIPTTHSTFLALVFGVGPSAATLPRSQCSIVPMSSMPRSPERR